MPKPIKAFTITPLDQQKFLQGLARKHTPKNAIKLRDLVPQPEAEPFLHQALIDAQNTNYEGMGKDIKGRGFITQYRDFQRGQRNPVISRLLENDDMVDKIEQVLMQEGITALDTPQPVRSPTYGQPDDPAFQPDPHAPMQGYDSAVMFSPDNIAVKFSNERKAASTEVPQFARFSRSGSGDIMKVDPETIPLYGVAQEKTMLVEPDVARGGILKPPRPVALAIQPEYSYTHPIFPDLRDLNNPEVRRIRQVLDMVLNRQGYNVEDMLDNSGNVMYASQDPTTLEPVAIDGRFTRTVPSGKPYRRPTPNQYLGKMKYAVPAAIAAQEGESPLSGLMQ